MFSLLTDKLEDAFKKLRGLGRISESNITDAMKDIRLALLEADVDFQVTKDLLEAVKTEAMGEEVLRSVSPGQQIVKIFNDELVKILGGGSSALNLEPPHRILMVGLNGAGKTTTSAKLANWLKKQGKRPVLIALDLYRPAAIKQLQVPATPSTPPSGPPPPAKSIPSAPPKPPWNGSPNKAPSSPSSTPPAARTSTAPSSTSSKKSPPLSNPARPSSSPTPPPASKPSPSPKPSTKPSASPASS